MEEIYWYKERIENMHQEEFEALQDRIEELEKDNDEALDRIGELEKKIEKIEKRIEPLPIPTAEKEEQSVASKLWNEVGEGK
jgi:predicted  nucleic acid-binding Zn-ribbon protein